MDAMTPNRSENYRCDYFIINSDIIIIVKMFLYCFCKGLLKLNKLFCIC